MPYNPSEAVKRFRKFAYQFDDDLPDPSEVEQFLVKELALCRQQVLSEVEEVIGEEEPFNIKRTPQLEEKINRDLRGVINDKIAARNIFRAELRTKLASLTTSKETNATK